MNNREEEHPVICLVYNLIGGIITGLFAVGFIVLLFAAINGSERWVTYGFNILISVLPATVVAFLIESFIFLPIKNKKIYEACTRHTLLNNVGLRYDSKPVEEEDVLLENQYKKPEPRMTDLVKRLREGPQRSGFHDDVEIFDIDDAHGDMIEAADKIEQLERTLAAFIAAQTRNLQRISDLQAELATEKALADALYENKDGSWKAYRKARGL